MESIRNVRWADMAALENDVAVTWLRVSQWQPR
jgi:hypothetical protein